MRGGRWWENIPNVGVAVLVVVAIRALYRPLIRLLERRPILLRDGLRDWLKVLLLECGQVSSILGAQRLGGAEYGQHAAVLKASEFPVPGLRRIVEIVEVASEFIHQSREAGLHFGKLIQGQIAVFCMRDDGFRHDNS